MKAVKFDQYGGTEVLEVREVDAPESQPGRVIVAVRAAGINPGEIALREGVFHDRWPATFPSGEGSDFAGTVTDVGEGVADWSVGDEVIGWSDERAAHAELVSVPAEQLVAKPAALSWEVAGSLYVAPTAGYASVEAVGAGPGDTVVVSGAAGGSGGFAAQLAKVRGATMIGLAGEHNHEWLAGRGITPVQYGDGQLERIRDAAGDHGVDAFIDTYGGGYLDLALELGVSKDRMNTIIDFAGAARLGVSTDGNASLVDPQAAVAEIAAVVADGSVELPIAATYPLAEVRDAYAELAKRHTRGKRVLVP